MSSLAAIAPNEVFAAYMRLFEALPNMLVFDRILFVHAGIPRDETIAARWTSVSSLNEPEIRFQMLWSDPSEVDAIPAELQKSTARFPFGKRQFKSFMQKLGCTTLIRGHERVPEGLSVHPFHGDVVDGLVVQLLHADLVDRDDVRMVQRRRGACLLGETLQPAAIRDERGRKDLQGHDALEVRVGGLVDRAHPSRTQEREDAVAPDLAAGEVSVLGHRGASILVRAAPRLAMAWFPLLGLASWASRGPDAPLLEASREPDGVAGHSMLRKV
jgi:hypothetical protein